MYTYMNSHLNSIKVGRCIQKNIEPVSRQVLVSSDTATDPITWFTIPSIYFILLV